MTSAWIRIGYNLSFTQGHIFYKVQNVNTLVREREFRALESAALEYPKATKRLLILTRDAMPSEVPPKVVVQPAYEWLLD